MHYIQHLFDGARPAVADISPSDGAGDGQGPGARQRAAGRAGARIAVARRQRRRSHGGPRRAGGSRPKIYRPAADPEMVSVWARTEEAEPRLGTFLVPAGLPGSRIVETWDHSGLRASGSHDLVLEDVLIPLDHEIDVRTPEAWRRPIPG